LGMGGPFLDLVALLLSGTAAAARVGGHQSSLRYSRAGVRQGCPLSPLLYLVVAQTLHRWLQHCGLGVTLAGQRLVALQYADDTEVLLAGPHQAPHFVEAMRVFGEATGQRMHGGKTVALCMGAPAAPDAPAHLGGIRVVGETQGLGLTWRAGVAGPAVDWEGLLAAVRQRYARAVRLGLSAVGRGIASAAYGMSTMLYAAEFVGHPPPGVEEQLHRATRELVLLGRVQGAPARAAPAMPRVAARLLPGSPLHGGWGVLPWRAHVSARHARWAGALLDPGRRDRPWVGLARHLLRQFSGTTAELAVLPPPVRRIVCALQALPPPALLEPHGDACGAPLEMLLPSGWDAGGAVPHRCRTLYDLLLNRHACRGLGVLGRTGLQRVEGVLARLPPGWAAAPLQLPDPVLPGWLSYMGRVAWGLPDGRRAAPWRLTVRAATALQLADARAARAACFEVFAGAAGGTAQEVRALFRFVWRLPLDNRHKEVFWGLVYDAFLTPERAGSGRLREQPCVCGAAVPGRQHFFWECEVARAVVGAVQQCLPTTVPALRREHVWLLRPPAGLPPGSWGVVCLAALGAMDSARRFCVASRLQGGQQVLAAPPALLQAVMHRAPATFWAILSDFCALSLAPAAWRALDHTFFAWLDDAWRLCRPQ